MENNNFEQIPENQTDVDFSIDNDIPVVSVSTEKNNKLPIILIICVLAIVLIAGILLFIFKSQDAPQTPETNTTEAAIQEENLLLEELYSEVLQEVITDESGSEISREEYITQIQQQIQEATTIINQNVGVTSPNKIEEVTTSANNPQTGNPDANSQQQGNSNANSQQQENPNANSQQPGNPNANTQQQGNPNSNSQQTENPNTNSQQPGNPNSNPQQPGTPNANPQQPENPNSNSQQAETTTAKPLPLDKAEIQIKAFFDRSFYLQGALYSGGTGDPLHMSLDNDNYEIITNLDGTEISFLKIDGKMYLKRLATKQYIELSESFFKALGIDPGLMSFNFGDISYEDIRPNVKTTDITINGNPGKCYSYENNDQLFRFYTEKDDLKQIEIYDADGTIVSEFAIDVFSESIPGDHLTLKGYERTGMGAMFADLL